MRNERGSDHMRELCLLSYLWLFLPNFIFLAFFYILSFRDAYRLCITFHLSSVTVLSWTGQRWILSLSWERMARGGNIVHPGWDVSPLHMHSYTQQGNLESAIHLRMVGGNLRTWEPGGKAHWREQPEWAQDRTRTLELFLYLGKSFGTGKSL